MRKLFQILFLMSLLISCTSDDDNNDLNPSNNKRITHFFNNQLDTLVTIPSSSNSSTILIERFISGGNKQTFFQYGSNRIQSLTSFNTGAVGENSFRTIKQISYTGNKINSITIEEQAAGPDYNIGNWTTIDKYREEFNYNSSQNNPIVTINRKKLDLNSNAVISEDIFEVTYKLIFNSQGIEVGTNILKVKNISTNNSTEFIYDDKSNIYNGFISLNELSLIYWQNQRITANNIISINLFENNTLTQTKNYQTFYTGNKCLEINDGNLIKHKFTYL